MLGVSRRGPDEEDLAASFLQSDFWGEFKAGYGWMPLRLELEIGEGAATPNGTSLPLLILVRRLGAGFSFAYAPLGPGLELAASSRSSFLAELSEGIEEFLPRGCLFIRYDPPWYELEPIASAEEGIGGAGVARPIIGSPLRRAAVDVQPPDTVFVDLRHGEADILAAMKAKWRYNIRLAEKKGVLVEEAGLESIDAFYELNRATAMRDRIALRPESYYSRLFSLAAERKASGMAGAPDIRLWIARYEGEALAAIITLFRGEEAVYLYGASSDEKRNLMPTYALQWTAMRAAKASGCRRYDLYGIPPLDDPEHPMAGLYRFKTGFGGAIAHYAGSWDYPLRTVPYALFRAAERTRAWWYKDFKKRIKKN